MSAFTDFLAAPTAKRCWLLEVDAFPLAPISDGSLAASTYGDHAFGDVAYGEDADDPAVDGRLYYSTHGYISKDYSGGAAAGDPASKQWYDGRLVADDIAIDRRIYGRDGIGGLTRTNAACKLVNADGGLDTLTADYGLDARQVRLLVGSADALREDFGLAFSGVVQKATIASDLVLLDLSDGTARMDSPVNTETYGGTGGMDGGADLAGKPKPVTWGAVFNITPPLVDSSRLIYQVHRSTVNDIPAVYDRQIALTQGSDYTSLSDIQTTAPSAGQYRVWPAGGAFRLGSTPAGQVTCDVEGDADGGYVDTTADILARALLVAGIDSSFLDSAAFADLATDAPASVGIHIGIDSTPVSVVVEKLLEGIGAFGGFSRLNLFTVGIVRAPSGTAAASFTEEQIRYIVRDPLPPTVDPTVWRARVAWSHNYTVQTDLAAAVTAARRTFAAAADRLVSSEDAGVLSRRPLAKEYGPNGNLFAEEADATSEADRLLDLWSVPRGLYRVGLPASALERDLGEVITIDHPRHGFSGGVDALILGHRIYANSEVEVTVLA